MQSRKPSQQGHTFNGVQNQAIVHVDVSSGEIECFPQRAGETLVFNCWDPEGHPPGARPCEVRWVVTGLQSGQFVRIVPKAGAVGAIFPDLKGLEVRHGFNSATSGEPAQRAGAGQSLGWTYSIELWSEKLGRLKELDPGIIIKDYP
jgi:hypothetical protein